MTGTFQRAYGPIQMLFFNQEMIRVVRGDGEDADMRCGKRLEQRSQHADILFEIEWAFYFQAAPAAFGLDLSGHRVLCTDH